MSDGVGRGARLAQRVLLLTARRPFLGAWRVAYELLARIAARAFARGDACTVYLRGSLRSTDFVPALSDLDVVIVLDPSVDQAASQRRIRARWESLRRRLPAAASVVDRPLVIGADDLREIVGQSVYTIGRVGGMDRLRMLEHPRIRSTTESWKRVRGPEVRPPEPPRDDQQERIAAWLDVVWHWTLLVQALSGRPHPHAARLCVKLVSEPARALAWLTRREALATQSEALASALATLPGHEEEIRRVIAVHEHARRLPPPPFDAAVPVLAELTDRVAEEIDRQLEAVPRTVVVLVGRDTEGSLPLCDWRALVQPGLAPLSFTAKPGLDSLAWLRDALAEEAPGQVSARLGRATIVFPAREREIVELRVAGCRASDPVSLALAASAETASFPACAGWSAGDWARHAVTAHRHALPAASTTGSLLAAARAALFAESLEAGRPQLTLTLPATHHALRERGLVREASGLEREVDDEAAVAELRRAVALLPAFAG